MLFILSNYVFTFLVPSCDAYYDFHVKMMFNSSLLHLFCQEFIFVSIYTQICPTQFPYQMMFVSSNSNTTANPSGGPEFTPCFFLWGSCCSIFSFLCSFLKISVLLSFDLWLQIAPLISPKCLYQFFMIKGYTWLQSNLNVSSMIASSLFMTIIWFPHTPQTLGSNLFPGKPLSV